MNEAKTILEPIAGYLVDIYAKLRNRIFIPHSYTKLHNLKLCRDLTGAITAVEIGSFKGVTAKRLSYLFKNVVTVEIDPDLHRQSKARCKGRANIELLLGDGAVLIPDIAARVKNAVLFLDGHHSGGKTGLGDEPEPVLKELDLIAAHLDNFVAVVVDDFRLFGVERDWPMKHEVMAKLENLFKAPHWQIAVLNDQYLAIRLRK